MNNWLKNIIFIELKLYIKVDSFRYITLPLTGLRSFFSFVTAPAVWKYFSYYYHIVWHTFSSKAHFLYDFFDVFEMINLSTSRFNG